MCCIQTHLVRPSALDETDEEVLLSEDCLEKTNLSADALRDAQPFETVLESFDRFLVAKGEKFLVSVLISYSR